MALAGTNDAACHVRLFFVAGPATLALSTLSLAAYLARMIPCNFFQITPEGCFLFKGLFAQRLLHPVSPPFTYEDLIIIKW